MNPLTKLRSVCALSLFYLVAVCAAAEPEQSFAAANCVFTPPAGWHRREIKNQPNLIAAFGDAEGHRTLLVLADERGKTWHTFTDSSVVEFDKGIEKGGGGPKTSGKFVPFAGFPSYERRGAAVIKGKNLSTLVVAIPTGDGLYALEALASQNEAADDPEIRGAINSFHFIRPPGPPHPVPDAAYKAGYLLGQSLMGLALLGVIVWGVTKAVASRRSPVPTGFSGPYPYPQSGFPPLPTAPPPFPPVGPTVPPPTPPPLPPG